MGCTIIFHFLSRLQETTHNPLGSRHEAQGCERSTGNITEEDGEITIWTLSCSLEVSTKCRQMCDILNDKFACVLCEINTLSVMKAHNAGLFPIAALKDIQEGRRKAN